MQNSASNFINKILGNGNKKNSNFKVNYGKNIDSGAINAIKIAGIFFLLLIITLIIYILYKYASKYKSFIASNPVIVSKPINTMNIPKEYRRALPRKTKLTSGPGVSMSYSLWVYVKDWNMNKKNIFYRTSSTANAENPEDNYTGMWLEEENNTLVVTTKFQPPCDNDSKKSTNRVEIKNFPLQKWVHVVYAINNSIIDVYVNGKLTKSALLTNDCFPDDPSLSGKIVQPVANDDDKIYILGQKLSGDSQKYVGQMSRFNYYAYALQPADVIELYSDGPY